MSFRDDLEAAHQQLDQLRAENRALERRVRQQRERWLKQHRAKVLVGTMLLLLGGGLFAAWSTLRATRSRSAVGQAEIAIRQRSTVKLPLVDHHQLSIGDIKRGRQIAWLAVKDADGGIVVERQRLVVGDRLRFSSGGQAYELRVTRLEDHLVHDQANLTLRVLH